MPRRRLQRALLIAPFVLLVAACGNPTGSGTPRPQASVHASPEPTSGASRAPSAPSEAPGESGPVASAPSVGQTDTDTEVGRIWDALPEGFPEYPGSNPTETGEGPVTAQFSVPADVATVAPYLQGAMETAGFSTESLSGPLEDGSVVLMSVGPESIQCRVRTTVAPAGGTTLVTVLYGSVCPFD
jgi:hypothetical protein